MADLPAPPVAPPAPPPAPPPGWDRPESPFHAGELAIQARLGIDAKIDRQGRQAVRAYLPEQHRAFFAQLPFILLGAADASGQPWATVLTGQPGFVFAPDATHLTIGAAAGAADPLAGALGPGADIGLLGIDLPTRRRNRLNGTVSDADASGLTVAVGQSFGNCPQYIQTRDARFVAAPGAGPVSRSDSLSAADRGLIAAADTFFIASANPRADAGAAKGADVSHRGGRPGFVRIDDARTLTTPDFVGNFLFNTIGNLTLDARAGLLFIDWATGDLLHLAGDAEVIWDGAEVRAFAGAERLLRVRLRAVVRRPGALPLRFAAPGFSPLLERTGDWETAARALVAERARTTWRPYRVTSTVAESATIRSFALEPADGGGLAPHVAGQHLPIRVSLPGRSAPVLRSYTISDAPDGRRYRISVKRDGAVSRFLHEHVHEGAVIEALAPRGAFVFDHASTRPAVLLSAGVGITPMIAMLNSLLVNEGRTRHHAPIFFIHGARDRTEQAFATHLRDKSRLHSNLTVHLRHSQPCADQRAGEHHDSPGRVDIALLKAVLPFDDYDFYLCGPASFMQAMYDGLRGLNVADERIRFEAFGPSTVKRSRGAPANEAAPAIALADDEAVEVVFARSAKRALWQPRSGTLLELAEAQGLTPDYSCRAGICGVCATALTRGAVDYAGPPSAQPGPGHVLICCSTPHPGPHLPDSRDREGVTLEL